MLVPNPAAVLVVLLVVVPSLPAAGLVVAGTRCPPSQRTGPAQSKGSGLPSGYRPIADRSPGKATLQSNHNDNVVKCAMPEVLTACALLGFRNAVAGLRDIGIGCVAVSPV